MTEPSITDHFPKWAPAWLKKLVEEPNCSSGSHPALRKIAKWLVVYMPPKECPGLAFAWLRFAADKCDRVPDDAELNRLLVWASGRNSNTECDDGYVQKTQVDVDAIYQLIVAGPTRNELRELSQARLYDTQERNTPAILDAWARYGGQTDPWVCYGSKDCFFTRKLSVMRERAHVFEQIVPSPMRDQYGFTVDGRKSQHSLDGTGPRRFLVIEFDFVPVDKQRKPTIWAPLIKACAERARDILDMNAGLVAHLRELGPLWMVVYSGGKSLQSWFPCGNIDEQSLGEWYRGEALPLGACRSTWCRSQFVRMPDGERCDGRRQSIEYINMSVLPGNKTAPVIPPTPCPQIRHACRAEKIYEICQKSYHRNSLGQ